jgi:hypothetical protein
MGQAAIVVALLALATLGWLLTNERMVGMDGGPGTDPGSLGFYVSVWIVMMVAMMLPSAPSMIVTYSMVQRRKRDLGRGAEGGGTTAFVGGYLAVWTAFGIVAYALFELVRSLDVDALDWSRNGPYAAAAVIAIAPSISSLRSRTSVWPSAAARSPSWSARGATGGLARFEWASSTAPGASAAAGLSWRRCSRSA